MISDPDPDLGMAVQLSSILRLLLDPENMMAASVVNVSIKSFHVLNSELMIGLSFHLAEIGKDGIFILFLQELHECSDKSTHSKYIGWETRERRQSNGSTTESDTGTSFLLCRTSHLSHQAIRYTARFVTKDPCPHEVQTYIPRTE